MAEFKIIKKKCYFCDNKRLIKFREHYYFCPECSCIYTYMIIQESHCKHTKDRIPVVNREPWYKEIRNKAYIKEGKLQICSKCGAKCIADGW